jgi:hypothetical protein
MSKTFIAFAPFQNLLNFLDGSYGFLEDQNGRTAYVSKEVFAASGFSLNLLKPDTVLEVEVVWSEEHLRHCVVKVLALHQPAPDRAELVVPYTLEQFCSRTKCAAFKRSTREELRSVHSKTGQVLYYVVVSRGTNIVLRFVYTTDIAEAKLAIGVRQHPPLTEDVGDSTLVTKAPEPKIKPVEVKPVVRMTTIIAPQAKRDTRVVLKSFADLVALLKREGVGETTH